MRDEIELRIEFFQNETLAMSDVTTRLLLLYLQSLQDEDGQIVDCPVFIKSKLFPSKEVDIEPRLDWLCEHNFIIRYTTNGKKFLQLIPLIERNFIQLSSKNHGMSPFKNSRLMNLNIVKDSIKLIERKD